VALLRDLTPAQWEVPSLCAGWSVRDAVIHSAFHSHFGPLGRVKELGRFGFSEPKQIAAERHRSTGELIDWLASPAKLGGGSNELLTQLSELVIHQQDVRRALGMPRPIPPECLAVVLDFGVSLSGLTWTMAFSRRRAKGLRLVGSDIGWWAGSGPEVRGAGEAILLALNGRAGAIDELTGDGVHILAARIKS
jgi:uncharacterized protein (TIGR03083 family)